MVSKSKCKTIIQNPKGFAIRRDKVYIPESASSNRSKITCVPHNCDRKYMFPWLSVQLTLFRVKNTNLRNAVAGLVELHMNIPSKKQISVSFWIPCMNESVCIFHAGLYHPPVLALVRWCCICGKTPRSFWKCDEDKNFLDPHVSTRKRMFLLALCSILLSISSKLRIETIPSRSYMKWEC